MFNNNECNDVNIDECGMNIKNVSFCLLCHENVSNVGVKPMVSFHWTIVTNEDFSLGDYDQWCFLVGQLLPV